jgi:hypothetical protein
MTYFILKDIKVKGWKKIFHINSNQKRVWIVILRSFKIDFKSNIITRDKEETF